MAELRPQQWQMLHFNPMGGAKAPALFNANSSITSLESIEVDEYGDSLTAIFSARVADLNISDLDIFEIQTRTSDLSPWVSIYCGEAKIPGIRKSYDNSKIKLIGLKQRLYEVAARKPIYGTPDSGGVLQDAYAVAAQIIKDTIDSGVIGTILVYDANLFTNTFVKTKQIAVGGSSVGRLLDLLAASGSAVWGVTPDRKVFFKLKPIDALSITESKTNIVKFKEPSAEGVVNRIDFFIPVPNVKDFATYTVVDQASIDIYSERRRTAPVPAEYSLIKEIKTGLTYEFITVRTDGSSDSAFADVTQADLLTLETQRFALETEISYDDLYSLHDRKSDYRDVGGISYYNPFVVISSGGFNDATQDGSGFCEVIIRNRSGKRIGLIAVAFRLVLNSLATYSQTALHKAIEIAFGEYPASPGQINFFGTNVIPSNPEEVYYPLSYYQTNNTSGNVSIETVTSGVLSPSLVHPGHSLYIEEFRPYEFDTDFLDKIGEALFKRPPEDPATVTLIGQIVAPKPRVELTTIDFGFLTRKAKLFRYKFMSDGTDYFTTEIEVEQSYNARDTGQSLVTKDRDASALGQSNQFTLATGRNNDDEPTTAPAPAGPTILIQDFILSWIDNTIISSSRNIQSAWIGKNVTFIVGAVNLKSTNTGLNKLELIVNGVSFYLVSEQNFASGPGSSSYSGSCTVTSIPSGQVALQISGPSGSSPGDIDPQSTVVTAIVIG